MITRRVKTAEMWVTICDRCKVEVDTQPTGICILHERKMFRLGSFLDEKKINLCPKCKVEFDRFMDLAVAFHA